MICFFNAFSAISLDFRDLYFEEKEIVPIKRSDLFASLYFDVGELRDILQKFDSVCHLPRQLSNVTPISV